MLPDEPTDEERAEQLAEDNETPFRPAAPAPAGGVTSGADAPGGSRLADDHPATDTNIQQEELYDEGISGAAEAAEPDTGTTVAGYTPERGKDDSEESAAQ